MTRAIAALIAALCVFSIVPASAQTFYPTDSIVGKWSSTLKGFDHSASPPIDFEENVVLTISANGNIHLERTRRLLKTTQSATWMADGVYTVPANGVIHLTFSSNLGQVPDTWTYTLQNNIFVIRDGSGITRKFYRVYTAI